MACPFIWKKLQDSPVSFWTETSGIMNLSGHPLAFTHRWPAWTCGEQTWEYFHTPFPGPLKDLFLQERKEELLSSAQFLHQSLSTSSIPETTVRVHCWTILIKSFHQGMTLDMVVVISWYQRWGCWVLKDYLKVQRGKAQCSWVDILMEDSLKVFFLHWVY